MPIMAMMMTIIQRNGRAGRTILRNRMAAISKMTATGMNAEFWLLFNHMHLLFRGKPRIFLFCEAVLEGVDRGLCAVVDAKL